MSNESYFTLVKKIYYCSFSHHAQKIYYCSLSHHDMNPDGTDVVVFSVNNSKLTTIMRQIPPDLNPVDYSIWGYFQQLVYRQKILNIQHLKDVIIDCWSQISQQFIDGAIDQWSRRIAAAVAARGIHIEYSFD